MPATSWRFARIWTRIIRGHGPLLRLSRSCPGDSASLLHNFPSPQPSPAGEGVYARKEKVKRRACKLSANFRYFLCFLFHSLQLVPSPGLHSPAVLKVFLLGLIRYRFCFGFVGWRGKLWTRRWRNNNKHNTEHFQTTAILPDNVILPYPIVDPNSQDTLEVSDVPNVACASPEDSSAPVHGLGNNTGQ
jgi:hypothetical protein